MSKNRVEADYVEALRKFAELYWDAGIEQAHAVFEQPVVKKDDREFNKKATFRANAEKAVLQKLKLMAQVMSGAIHPNGSNTSEEKTAAAQALAEARKLLGAKAPKKSEAEVDDE